MQTDKTKTMDILALGDCNTGSVEKYDNVNIGDLLKTRLVEKGIDAKVDNFGKAMYTTREGVNHTQEIGKPYDVALLNFGLVDAWTTSVPRWYVLYYPSNPLRKTARKLLKSLKKRLRYPALNNIVPKGLVVPLDEYLDNIRRMVKDIRAINPDCHIIIWGIVPVRIDPDRDEDIKQYDAALADLAEQCDCVYIDTRALFEPYEHAKLYTDQVHINEKGQNIIINNMLQHII